jgi:hypothetical protein
MFVLSEEFGRFRLHRKDCNQTDKSLTASSRTHSKTRCSHSQHTSNALAPSSGIPTADVNCEVLTWSNFKTEDKAGLSWLYYEAKSAWAGATTPY